MTNPNDSIDARAVAMASRPCTHPERNGVHDWALTVDGKRNMCQACGAFDVPAEIAARKAGT